MHFAHRCSRQELSRPPYMCEAHPYDADFYVLVIFLVHPSILFHEAGQNGVQCKIAETLPMPLPWQSATIYLTWHATPPWLFFSGWAKRKLKITFRPPLISGSRLKGQWLRHHYMRPCLCRRCQIMGLELLERRAPVGGVKKKKRARERPSFDSVFSSEEPSPFFFSLKNTISLWSLNWAWTWHSTALITSPEPWMASKDEDTRASSHSCTLY